MESCYYVSRLPFLHAAVRCRSWCIVRPMIKLAVLALLFGVGCSDTTHTTTDGGGAAADLARAVADSGSPGPNDGGAGNDAASGKDASPGSGFGNQPCTVASDCRLFFSTCGECQCYAIRADNIDPVCNKNPNNCFQNTCNGKTAVCNAAGMCALP